MVYPGRIVKLRVRGTKKDLTQDISSEEVCVVIPGVIAHFDGSDIQNPKKDSEDIGNSNGRLPYQLWNVNRCGTCVDAAITGIMPPLLMELQVISNVALSLLAHAKDRNCSLMGAILSKVVPATFSTIASFSKMIWRSEQTPKRKSEEKPQSFARVANVEAEPELLDGCRLHHRRRLFDEIKLIAVGTSRRMYCKVKKDVTQDISSEESSVLSSQ
ncbi:hypothetical protein QUC31_002252, partial [Theobroma cacao]